MAKPTDLPIWATDGTNNDEPSLGQKESGWDPEQDAVSDYDNWWKKLSYDWAVYLNSGILQAPIRVDRDEGAMLDGGGELQVHTDNHIFPGFWGTSFGTNPWAVMVDPFGGLKRMGMYFYDEFDGNVGDALDLAADSKWTVASVGAASEAVFSAPHKVSMIIDDNASDAIGIVGNNFNVYREEQPRFRCWAHIPAALISNENEIRIGFDDIYFLADVANEANWQFVVVGDANSPFDLGASVDILSLSEAVVLEFWISAVRQIRWAIMSGENNISSSYEDQSIISGVLATAADIPNTAQETHIRMLGTGGGGGTMKLCFAEVFTASRKHDA